jgi:hypothetical protein
MSCPCSDDSRQHQEVLVPLGGGRGEGGLASGARKFLSSFPVRIRVLVVIKPRGLDVDETEETSAHTHTLARQNAIRRYDAVFCSYSHPLRRPQLLLDLSSKTSSSIISLSSQAQRAACSCPPPRAWPPPPPTPCILVFRCLEWAYWQSDLYVVVWAHPHRRVSSMRTHTK